MVRIIDFLNERKNFILYFLLKVLIMLLGLITNIVIVRKLSINDFGLFSLAFMFIGLITTFGFSWSSSSILYYGSQEKAKTGSINKTFWARNVIISASLILTTTLFVIFRNSINEYIGIEVTFLLLIWLYISVAEDYLSQYFLAVKKQLLSSMLSVTAKLIYLAMIFIFEIDVKTLILLNIISHSTVLFYIFGINKNDIGKFEFDKSFFIEILNFSLWQLFGFSGLYLINFGDTAVIKYFMTTKDVGIYNAAYKLFNTIANFSFVISSYYAGSVSQYFAKNQYKEIKHFFYKERFIIFGLSTFMHLIVIFFSKLIITKLYGEQYENSVQIFNILMLGSMFRYWGVFYMIYYNTNQKYKIQQTINIFRSVLNVILDIVLIQYFGLIGPAVATTISIVITLIFSIFYCEKNIFKTAYSKV
ncbi:lipopolysaccharide biosynthesis protein [Facklamia sp. P12945]|uniref:lipopolysaccharide biosynthesis protein n=1 Tax=Facklamia sp. P12945 TaxID=3421950 RepID=UPI003D16C59C